MTNGCSKTEKLVFLESCSDRSLKFLKGVRGHLSTIRDTLSFDGWSGRWCV